MINSSRVITQFRKVLLVMTCARKFYLTFMKLAKAVNNSKDTSEQLARRSGKYIQPLAECFDDDGLNVMDSFKLTGGYMVTNYKPECPLYRCDKLNAKYFYIKHVNMVNDKPRLTLKFPDKKTILKYMKVLLNMAMSYSINRPNSIGNGVFWGDKSYITPKEEYHMLHGLGILVPRALLDKDNYRKHLQILLKAEHLHQTIDKYHRKIAGCNFALNHLDLY